MPKSPAVSLVHEQLTNPAVPPWSMKVRLKMEVCLPSSSSWEVGKNNVLVNNWNLITEPEWVCLVWVL